MKTLKEQIKRYCETKGISQNEFSAKAGVNMAFVSNIMNGKGVSKAVQNQITAFLAGRMVSGLLETKDFTKAFKYMEMAKENAYLVGLIGDTGVGKTTALKAFATRENVFYIRADKTLSARQMVFDLAAEMGLQTSGTVSQVLRACCKKLNKLENPLVLVDECGKLKPLQMMYLQELRDNTEQNAGIVLAGMPYFREKMLKGCEKSREGYAEMFSRIQLWVTLQGLTADEIRKVLEAEGMEPTPELMRKHLFRDLTGLVRALKIKNMEAAERR